MLWLTSSQLAATLVPADNLSCLALGLLHICLVIWPPGVSGLLDLRLQYRVSESQCLALVVGVTVCTRRLAVGGGTGGLVGQDRLAADDSTLA